MEHFKTAREYSSTNDKDIIATTLIGETGGNVEDAKHVYWVLKNRANKRGTTMIHEALRPKQFSMWNMYTVKKTKTLQDTITFYKNHKNWYQRNWDDMYTLVANPPTIDPTQGATNYYAHKKVLPYWAKVKSWVETVTTNLHTYGKFIK